MVRRVESPSSINTYKQCPRKYYYSYILKLPRFPSIHTLRGNIIHTILEDFFDLDVKHLDLGTFEAELKTKIQQMLLNNWLKNRDKMSQFGLTKEQEMFYFEESMMMMFNWFGRFSDKIHKHPSGDFGAAFQAHTPVREEKFESPERKIRGFIDAIEKMPNEVRIMDYKTSKRFTMSPAYKLQLAIYALLYQDKYGKQPDKVGIYFLKDTGKHEHVLTVDQEMVTWAKEEVELMHYNTKSDLIEDYPLVKTPLCKWSTGQCDFYEYCYKGKKVN